MATQTKSTDLTDLLLTQARRAHAAFRAGNLADLRRKAEAVAELVGASAPKALRSQHGDLYVAARRQLAGINWVAFKATQCSVDSLVLDGGTRRAIAQLIDTMSANDLTEPTAQRALASLMGYVQRELVRGGQMAEELEEHLNAISEVPNGHFEVAPAWAREDSETLLSSSPPHLPLAVRLEKAKNLSSWLELERNKRWLARQAANVARSREAHRRTGSAKKRNRPKKQAESTAAKPRRSHEEMVASLPLGKPNPQGFGQERGKVVAGSGVARNKRKK